METLSYGNLQSHWTTTKLWKLTVVLDYYEAMETYSRIGLFRSYGNLQSYWTTTKLWKLTVVLDYNEAMEAYSRIGLKAIVAPLTVENTLVHRALIRTKQDSKTVNCALRVLVFSTRFECVLAFFHFFECTLKSSAQLLHSFRV